MAMASAMPNGQVSESKRLRRARARRNRRLRMQDCIRGNRGGRVGQDRVDLRGPARSMGMILGRSGRPGYSTEAVPNENYEPMMPAITGSLNGLNLSALGSTQMGQRWALKALHPNGESVTASAGIPDHTNVPVVTPEFRTNIVIPPVPGNTNQDLDIMFPPFPDVALMYRRYESGTTQDLWKNWNVVYYPAVELRDSGAFRQTIIAEDELGDFGYIGSNLTDMYSQLRVMYRGATVHLDAPALADQGRIVAGQIALEFGIQNYVEVEAIPGGQVSSGAVTWETITSANLANLAGKPPLTEDDLFQVNPGTIAWEAREGVYMPLRFKNPVHMFQNVQANYADSNFINPALIAFGGKTISQVVTKSTPQWGQAAVAAVDNSLTGIVLVRGISSVANVQVKVRAGYEAQVGQVSQAAVFQHASPPLDQFAIDQVTRVSQTTAMAYPASYNDLSSILNIIKQVVGIAKPIFKGIGGLGIPIVSDIAGGIGTVADSLGLSTRRRRRRVLM